MNSEEFGGIMDAWRRRQDETVTFASHTETANWADSKVTSESIRESILGALGVPHTLFSAGFTMGPDYHPNRKRYLRDHRGRYELKRVAVLDADGNDTGGTAEARFYEGDPWG